MPAKPMFLAPSDTLKGFATIKKPACPKCGRAMAASRAAPGALGYQELTFACSTCGQSTTLSIPIDPLRSDAVGWLRSELRPPK